MLSTLPDELDFNGLKVPKVSPVAYRLQKSLNLLEITVEYVTITAMGGQSPAWRGYFSHRLHGRYTVIYGPYIGAPHPQLALDYLLNKLKK